MDQDKGAAKEAKAANNYGTWFAVTRASFLVHLGGKAEAKAWIKSSAARLAPLQFTPDGQQPLEASRADGISYSRYSL